MDIRIAGTVNESIVDGPGFRYTVFTQGCHHGCLGCHNPETHDFCGGHVVNTDDLIAEMKKNTLLDGLTLSGGDPFEQWVPCTQLAKGAQALGLNVWAYTGYRWEELMLKPQWRALIEACDIVVDGRFVQKQRTLDLRFRGSRNQRLIDVRASLEAGRAVEYMLDFECGIRRIG